MYRLQKMRTFLSVKVNVRDVSTESYLTLNDMPKPKSLPFFGTSLEFIASNGGSKLHEYIDDRHKNLGPIFYEKIGEADTVFVSDPCLMKKLFLNLEGKYPKHLLPDAWLLYEKLYGSKRGLFFLDDEEWLSVRRVMNKYLLRENAEKWLEGPTKACVTEFVNNWKSWKIVANNDDNNIPINLESDFYKLSNEVLIATLIGEGASLLKNKRYKDIMDVFSEQVKRIFTTTTNLFGLPLNVVQKWNLKAWRDFKDSVDRSVSIAHKLIEDMSKETTATDGLLHKLGNHDISDEMVKRLVADFIIAAGDTSSYTILWTLYLLCNNQNIIEEIRNKDKQFTKAVIKESMRLYPVAPFLTRILPKESILGDYKLNKGVTVVASIYTSGRDEQYFSQADKFLPFRWVRTDPRRSHLENHELSASLPFALGTRSCIGKKMAMLLLTETIEQIVNNFDIRSPSGNKDVKAITSQILIPNQPLDIEFTLRK